MKKMMMALAALCVAGAASAITVQWGSNTAFGAGTHTLGSTTDFSTGSTAEPLTVEIVISGISHTEWIASQNVTLFTVYGSNGTGEGSGTTPKSYFDLKIQDGNLMFGVAGNKGSDGGYRSDNNLGGFVELVGESNSLTLTLTKTGNDRENITITIGSNAPVQVAPTGGAGTSFGFASGYQWNTIDVSPVPEPTALALLALGVAGLALRRKVA